MTTRISFVRLIQAGKETLRKIFKPHQGTKVETRRQVFQHQKDVSHQVPNQAPQFVHSKSTLFGKIIPRVYYRSLASELSRRAAQRSCGRESSPLFAFAGLALLSSFQKKEEEIVMGQISEMGKTSQECKDFQMGHFPCLSLGSFQLGQMIGKGCYAAVYEAKLKDKAQSLSSFEENLVEKTNEDDRDTVTTDLPESDTESTDIISNKLDLELEVETDSDIIVIDQSECDTESIDIIYKPEPGFKSNSIIQDESVSAELEFSEEDILGITEFRSLLSPETVDLHDPFISLDQDSFVILSQSDPGENDGHLEQETAPPDYNLAIKIMYNYQIESKASAIMREMEKEMVPAKLAATHAQMNEWDNGNRVRKRRLPPHPNIVNMMGVFVDPFPQLPEGLEHYPAALPKRLNPDGIGRNQTMFIVMKRYDMNLHEYLQIRHPDMHTRILLLAQLLEGVVHMGRYGVAHRDMKNDNILLECSTGEIPQLVIGDFGCCLADSHNGLKLPYPTEEVDRGGNSALMAPEISNAVPGPNHFLDYSKSDLWSVGALAYEIFDQDNPFYSRKGRKNLDSRTYRESDLPSLPDIVPLEVRKLVSSLLQRDPTKRPTPEVAADALYLYLWAPSHWWLPGNIISHHEVRWQLAFLAAEVSILRLSQSVMSPEFYLKSTFLSRLCMENVNSAIGLLQRMQ